MATRQNIVVNDRAATPVAHTFTPNGKTPTGWDSFTEKTPVTIGNPALNLRLAQGNGRYKPAMKLIVPVVQTQTINGVSTPVVVRTAFADVSFNFDGLSTEQERKDAVAFVANALAANQTMINALITGLEPIF